MPLSIPASPRLAVPPRIALALVVTILLLGLRGPAQAAPPDAPPASVPPNPVPAVTLSVPSAVFIGENFTFTATFDNTDPTPPPNGDDAGYGPYIDIYLPATGADGAGAATDDGITALLSATYLGAPLNVVQRTFNASGVVNHPYAVTAAGSPVQITGGTPGDRLYSIELPFGSFTPEQPPVTVNITATLSNLADVGTPLTIRANGGFRYGATPLNDWCCGDPSIIGTPGVNVPAWPGAPVTPTLLAISKAYNGPEDETATGPNFVRQYTISVDVATGQTITDLDVTDILPDNIQFVALVGVTPSPPPPGSGLTSTPSTTTPGGTLTYRFTSITGGAGSDDATVTFSFTVPYNDAGGTPVINPPAQGDDASSINDASAQANWTPVDTRDPAGPVSAPCPNCHILTDKSIAVQKGVTLFAEGPGTAPGYTPGDTVQYTLDFQISDYFAFQNVVLTDLLGDGQAFDASFTPTLSVTERGGAASSGAMNPANYTVNRSMVTGITTLTFRVSDELVTRGLNGGLQGGCVPGGAPVDPDCTGAPGPTTGSIVFRAIIEENYVGPTGTGDSSVDHGDTLTDDVTILGDLLDPVTLNPNGNAEADDSAASLTIVRGSLTKSIYAVNGSTSLPSPLILGPGDTITYRLVYTLPSTDFESLRLDDYLPLPVLLATEVTTFNPVVGGVPPAGEARYGPGDTLHSQPGAPAPTLSTDAVSNRLTFAYGTYDGNNTEPSAVDLLFTVTVRTDPFADGLFLTNQAQAYETDSFGNPSTSDAIIQFELGEPVLVTPKSVVASSNPAGVFNPLTVWPSGVTFNAPGTAGPRWTGIITNANIGNALNSNITNINGGDILTFAITIRNTGGSPHGAFDIQLRDVIPAAMQLPPGGLNLRVAYGNAALELVHNPAPGNPGWIGLGGGPDGTDNTADDLFGTGIELVDPGPDVGACQVEDLVNGRNIVIVTYDLQVRPGVAPNQVITNTATIFNFAGREGGPDHTSPSPDNDLRDSASVTIASAGGKTGNPPTVTVGETYTQTIVVTIPPQTNAQGRLVGGVPGPFVYLRDTISDNGAHAVAGSQTYQVLSPCDPTDISAPAYQNAALTITDTAGGEQVEWAFPPINNTNGLTACSFQLTIDIQMRDQDLYDGSRNWLPPSDATLDVDDTAQFRYSDGSANQQFTAGTHAEPVQQPVISTSKTIPQVYQSDGVTPRTGEARRGDIVVFTLGLTNVGLTTAYEVNVEDVLQTPNLEFVSGSAFLDANGNGIQDGGEVSLPNPTITGDVTTTQTLNFNTSFDIAPGAGNAVRITYRVRVLSSMPLGSIIQNVADADWSTMDGSQPYERSYDDSAPIANDGGQDSASTSLQVIGLQLSKDFNPPVVPLATPTSRLTFVVTNPNASTDLTQVTFVDNLPAGLLIANPSNLVTDCGGTLTADPGTATVALTDLNLPRGASCSIALDVTGAGPAFYDNATTPITSAETGQGLPARDTLIVADTLAVQKQFNPDQIAQGGTSQLVFTLFNGEDNPSPATDISLLDTLPPGVTVVNPGVPVAACNGTVTTTATTISLTGGSLAFMESCTFSVEVTAPVGGYDNVSDPIQSSLGVGSASNVARLTVIPRPEKVRSEGALAPLLVLDPFLLKSVEPARATIGEVVTWTIHVTNPGSVPLSPVIVSDPVPSVLDITHVTTSQGTPSINGQVVTVDLGQLDPGATATITIQTVGNATATPGEVCNAATSGSMSSTACLNLMPGRLPDTGGPRFNPWPWVGLALVILTVATLGWRWLRRQIVG